MPWHGTRNGQPPRPYLWVLIFSVFTVIGIVFMVLGFLVKPTWRRNGMGGGAVIADQSSTNKAVGVGGLLGMLVGGACLLCCVPLCLRDNRVPASQPRESCCDLVSMPAANLPEEQGLVGD